MKRSLTLLFSSLIVLSLASCHGRKSIPNFEIPTELDMTREYNISFWEKYDGYNTQEQAYKKAISEFEELYPNIHVTMQQETSYPDLYKAIVTNIGTNTYPNIAICYPDHVATYLENPSLVVELDELISDAKYGFGGSELKFKSTVLDDYIPEYLSEGYLYRDGIKKLFCVPFVRSVEAMYVNKTWIENNGFDMPKDNIFTWDKVWEICEYAYRNNKNMFPLIYQSSDNFFITLCTQNGYDYTTNDGEILFVNDDNKSMMKMLNEKFNLGCYKLKSRTGVYPGDMMNKGLCIFGIDSTAGSTWIGHGAPWATVDEVDYELVITVPPQVDTNNVKLISQGPSLCLFNKDDPMEVLASWLFLQYLLTDDIQIAYAKTEGYCPVTTTALNSAEFQSFLTDESVYKGQRDAINTIIKYRSNTFITPAFSNSSLVRTAVSTIIDKVSIRMGATVDIDDAFNRAYTDCNAD